jgi:hypothetical protein
VNRAGSADPQFRDPVHVRRFFDARHGLSRRAPQRQILERRLERGMSAVAKRSLVAKPKAPKPGEGAAERRQWSPFEADPESGRLEGLKSPLRPPSRRPAGGPNVWKLEGGRCPEMARPGLGPLGLSSSGHRERPGRVVCRHLLLRLRWRTKAWKTRPARCRR